MTTLIKYEAACLALAESHRVDEVKDIHDKAEAMRVYAIQAKNVDLEVMASEIRLRGERRLGELLIEAKQAGRLSRGQPKKNCSDSEQYSDRLHLVDVGIDRKLSSRAQKLGGIAERAFEAMVGRMREQITERGSRTALSALSAEDKKERRASRERVLGGCQQALPDKKFGVILADPEWRFEPWSRETGMDRAADNHYPTTDVSGICERDVQSIAADDCVLFLWATAPMLPQAFLVMASWGFDYVSNYVWAKDRIGTGYWNRNKHEHLLVGTRGKIPAPAMGTQWPSLIEAPVGAHSAKPECFLEMIEAYFPTLPKIELNRRGPARLGWKAWGNEGLTIVKLQEEAERPTSHDIAQPPQTAGPQSLEDDAFHIPDFCLRSHPDCTIGRHR
jgi:N6-adenosine-specific RNA methylase IME4